MSKSDHMQGRSLVYSAQKISGQAYKIQNNVVRYFQLREENDSLIAQNAFLQEQLSLSKTTDHLPDYTITQSFGKADTVHHITFAEYKYRTARVINNSVSKTNNFITINRGSASGIKENMAVITGEGAVGKVIRTSENYAVVLSIISEIQPVSVRLKNGFTGIVRWDPLKPEILQMKNVPREYKIKIGDTVKTTNYSFFPEGILVGTVHKVYISKKHGRKVLYINPAADFRRLKYLYIIENTKLEKKLNLEDSVKLNPIR